MVTWSLAGLLVAACTTSEPAPVASTFDGRALGTTWHVVVVDAVEGDAVPDAITSALADVDAHMSTWRDDSELSAVRAGEGPVAVSPDTAFVVGEALALAEATGGAFDPTVQPLMAFWGLLGTPRTSWPTDDEITAARATVGFDRVVVGGTDAAPTVDAGGAALDLSAIAKGHAVDRVLAAVTALGHDDVFVEVGGEVATSGHSARGDAWRVGVEAPEAGARRLMGSVALDADGPALATSGNYRTAYEVDGHTIHHTLDPRTGRPAQSDVLSASVLAPTCREADGWATALMVLGADEGMRAVLARPELEAFLVVSGDAGPAGRATPGMVDRLGGVEVDVAVVGD